MGPQKAGKADRAMDEFEHVETGPLDRRASEVHVSNDLPGIAAAIVLLGQLCRPCDPELCGLGRHRRLARAGQLVRIGAPAGLAQVQARLVEQAFDAAQLDRGETPGPGREARFAVVVAFAPDDVVRAHGEAGEVIASRRRRPHAMRAPIRQIGTADVAGLLVETRKHHQDAAVIDPGRHQWAPDEAGAGGEGLAAPQAPAGFRFLQRQGVAPLRIPHAEQHALVRIARRFFDLRCGSKPHEQRQRVHVPFVQSAKREAAVSDPAQHIQQGGRTLRRRAQPKAAICRRHGRLEGADGGKRVNILGRERAILVEIAGARGGQAGNIAHLFDQSPRFATKVQARRARRNGPFAVGPQGPMFKRGGERMFPRAGRRCSAVLSGMRLCDWADTLQRFREPNRQQRCLSSRPAPAVEVSAGKPRNEIGPMIDYPKPPFPKQKQPMPGFTRKMDPVPDHGEQSYKGSGRLAGKKAIITGGDSGIGRAVALAFAREGADVLISYLSEHEDAEETKRLVEDAGRKAVLLAGDIKHAAHCRAIVDKAVSALGGVDILVNNAAHQASFKELEDISEEEWELTFKVNIHAMFYLTKAAVPHMKPGSAIINTASINSDMPNPTLLAYATTKGAIQNFTAGLAQLLAPKGIRANAVAPGPIWTPLIPSTMPEEAVINFGKQVPMKRPGQPAELATAYVMLADPLSSYVSGATIAVTGGKPIL